MNTSNSQLFQIVFFFTIIQIMSSCNNESGVSKEDNQMQQELEKVNGLLRDPVFTEAMAKTLDSSYYAGIGQTQPPFISPGDDTTKIIKTTKSEKIATNLAGFYALECGIGLLSAGSGTTPVQWLQKITDKTIDSNSILLLNRFANATWKAGQPFRDLNRITRPNFIIASSLSREEIDKDFTQIFHAAKKLLSSMTPVMQSPLPEQMKLLRSLLQDTAYAVEMAGHLYSSYDPSQTEPFLTPADDTSKLTKTARQIKIATSIAGFYALECGLNYLVTTRNASPSVILQSLVNNSMSVDDKMLFARFANATWKAGQPFRDLNRITRETFAPFYFLSEADIEKDLVQIRAAASRLLSAL